MNRLSSSNGRARHRNTLHGEMGIASAPPSSIDAVIMQHLLSRELQQLEQELALRTAPAHVATGLLQMEMKASNMQTQADCKHLEVTLQAARCEHTTADTVMQNALQQLGQQLREAQAELAISREGLAIYERQPVAAAAPVPEAMPTEPVHALATAAPVEPYSSQESALPLHDVADFMKDAFEALEAAAADAVLEAAAAAEARIRDLGTMPQQNVDPGGYDAAQGNDSSCVAAPRAAVPILCAPSGRKELGTAEGVRTQRSAEDDRPEWNSSTRVDHECNACRCASRAAACPASFGGATGGGGSCSSAATGGTTPGIPFGSEWPPYAAPRPAPTMVDPAVQHALTNGAAHAAALSYAEQHAGPAKAAQVAGPAATPTAEGLDAAHALSKVLAWRSLRMQVASVADSVSCLGFDLSAVPAVPQAWLGASGAAGLGQHPGGVCAGSDVISRLRQLNATAAACGLLPGAGPGPQCAAGNGPHHELRPAVAQSYGSQRSTAQLAQLIHGAVATDSHVTSLGYAMDRADTLAATCGTGSRQSITPLPKPQLTFRPTSDGLRLAPQRSAP